MNHIFRILIDTTLGGILGGLAFCLLQPYMHLHGGFQAFVFGGLIGLPFGFAMDRWVWLPYRKRTGRQC